MTTKKETISKWNIFIALLLVLGACCGVKRHVDIYIFEESPKKANEINSNKIVWCTYTTKSKNRTWKWKLKRAHSAQIHIYKSTENEKKNIAFFTKFTSAEYAKKQQNSYMPFFPCSAFFSSTVGSFFYFNFSIYITHNTCAMFTLSALCECICLHIEFIYICLLFFLFFWFFDDFYIRMKRVCVVYIWIANSMETMKKITIKYVQKSERNFDRYESCQATEHSPNKSILCKLFSERCDR